MDRILCLCIISRYILRHHFPTQENIAEIQTMNQVRLIFKELVAIEGGEGLSVIVLTDTSEQRALNIICDKPMSDQIMMRMNKVPHADMLLPEALLRVLTPDEGQNLEMMVRTVFDGQYQVTLFNKENLRLFPLRMSDAVLLSCISDVPLYIDEQLMNLQSTSYVPKQHRISVPINTLDTDRLHVELQHAVAQEDYRLASHLQKEIDKRITDKDKSPQ